MEDIYAEFAGNKFGYGNGSGTGSFHPKPGINENTNIIEDEEYYKEVRALYGNVLDASGLNLSDPVYATMTRFNRFQKRPTVDPPYIGKTYIFMTRPDLNLGGGPGLVYDKQWYRSEQAAQFKTLMARPSGYRNVMKNDLFAYFSRTEIGQHVLPWLMYPYGWEYSNDTYDPIKGLGDFTGKRELQLASQIGDYEIPNRMMIWTPFIPMVSNLTQSLSGGKDIALDIYETQGDFHGNKLKYAAGADESFTTGEVTLEVADITGCPMLHLTNFWVHYIHYLCKGMIVPKARYVRYRTLDYTCSIYVFVTERDGTTLQRWAKYTGCFPGNVPLGAIQHNLAAPAEGLKDLSLSFHYNRYEAMKPEVLVDFNYLMLNFIKKWGKKQFGMMNAGDEFIAEAYDENYKGDKLHFSMPAPLLEHNAAEILAANPDWKPPMVQNADGTFRIKTKADYDNIYWGRIPFILNNQLIFFM